MMQRTSPAVFHVLLFSTVAIVVACLTPVSSAVANVCTGPRPSGHVIDRSDIIAVCVAETVYGEPPFTHGSPPDQVILVVQRAIRGCAEGDTLRVFGWLSKVGPPSPPKGMGSTDPDFDRLREEWEKAPVAIPQGRNPTLVFLRGSSGDTLRQYIGSVCDPVFFDDPSEDLILRTTGLASLELDISLTSDSFAQSSPIVVRGTLRNVSQSQRTLDPRNISIGHYLGPTPHVGRSKVMESEDEHMPPAITLKPGESRKFEWDLKVFMGISRLIPGLYKVGLSAPARFTVPLQRRLLRFYVEGELTFEDAVVSCPVIWSATVRKVTKLEDGTVKVRFDEPEYIKNEPSSVYYQTGRVIFTWPQDCSPFPQEGDSVIVYLGGSGRFPDIQYGAKKTQQLMDTTRAILARVLPD
jgi:hypothetical protein